jgi:hypothetical protein
MRLSNDEVIAVQAEFERRRCTLQTIACHIDVERRSYTSVPSVRAQWRGDELKTEALPCCGRLSGIALRRHADTSEINLLGLSVHCHFGGMAA